MMQERTTFSECVMVRAITCSIVRGYKTFFMLNSTDHVIYSAYTVVEF